MRFSEGLRWRQSPQVSYTVVVINMVFAPGSVEAGLRARETVYACLASMGAIFALDNCSPVPSETERLGSLFPALFVCVCSPCETTLLLCRVSHRAFHYLSRSHLGSYQQCCDFQSDVCYCWYCGFFFLIMNKLILVVKRKSLSW